MSEYGSQAWLRGRIEEVVAHGARLKAGVSCTSCVSAEDVCDACKALGAEWGSRAIAPFRANPISGTPKRQLMNYPLKEEGT